MSIKLKNENLELTIETAGEKYTGSRFDWNGTVTQIKYKGISVLSQEKKIFHRNPRIFGRGLHNEFGIKNVIGYDDIPVGEYFPKIGTGWLKKDDKPYFFFTQYKLDPLNFHAVKVSDTKAVFECDSGERNGYAYLYTKTIELKGDTFTIDYKIENKGSKPLATTEYVHNFLLPGNRTNGPHLELTLPWKYDQNNFSENVKTENLIRFQPNGEITKIGFEKTPDVEFFMGGIFKSRKDTENKKAFWILKDSKSKLTIKEEDSFEPYNCDIWGHNKCISPELFTWFEAKPGETAVWNRTYSFSKD